MGGGTLTPFYSRILDRYLKTTWTAYLDFCFSMHLTYTTATALEEEIPYLVLCRYITMVPRIQGLIWSQEQWQIALRLCLPKPWHFQSHDPMTLANSEPDGWHSWRMTTWHLTLLNHGTWHSSIMTLAKPEACDLWQVRTMITGTPEPWHFGTVVPRIFLNSASILNFPDKLSSNDVL